TAREAGWPGLLIDEAHGGAGLDVFDAMLVLGECGRVLAGVPLLGHLPATAILADAPRVAEYLPALASGERRAAYLPSQPPSDLDPRWSADPAGGSERSPLPTGSAPDANGEVKLSGGYAFVPDAPGANALVGVALVDGEPTGVVIMADADGVQVESVRRCDALTRACHPQRRCRDRAGRTRGLSGKRLVSGPGADRRRVARQRGDGAGGFGCLRQGALYLRPGDRLLPGREALADRGVAPARERALAALLRRLVAQWCPQRVSPRGQRGALGSGAGTRPWGTHDDLGARRHRRYLGARRAAVLPSRSAIAAPARRDRGGKRQGGGRAHRPGRRGLGIIGCIPVRRLAGQVSTRLLVPVTLGVFRAHCHSGF